MNEKIMAWSSTQFYQGGLYAAPDVSAHRLSDLAGVRAGVLTTTVLRLIDTAGQEMRECSSQSRSAPSFANLGEAAVVIDYVLKLTNHGIKPDQIAIISPYKAQVFNKLVLKFNYILIFCFLGECSGGQLTGEIP